MRSFGVQFFSCNDFLTKFYMKLSNSLAAGAMAVSALVSGCSGAQRAEGCNTEISKATGFEKDTDIAMRVAKIRPDKMTIYSDVSLNPREEYLDGLCSRVPELKAHAGALDGQCSPTDNAAMGVKAKLEAYMAKIKADAPSGCK